ncbi:MAG: H-NS histone family protein [Chlorobiaceae bacterium]
MSTLADIKNQIAELERQAKQLVSSERKAVIAELREKMAQYGITAEELGKKGKAPKSGPKAAPIVRYRKSDTETYSGRGPKPAWLKAVEAAGGKLEDFKV